MGQFINPCVDFVLVPILIFWRVALMQRRRSQEVSDKASEAERKQLAEEILKLRDSYFGMEKRISENQHRYQKMVESNMRNEKRLLRYRARIEEMSRYKDSPEHFLSVTGHMNESIQEYILSHNYTFSTDPHQFPDPDNMTYEQLLDLGDKIGKVSKGLSKQEIQKLNHKRNKHADERCPICQNELQLQEVVIELPCRHTYHEECILYWLRDENTCPICKQSLASRGKEEKHSLL